MAAGLEAEAEVDENQKPEEPPTLEASPGKEERRSRKSRVHEVRFGPTVSIARVVLARYVIVQSLAF